MLARLESAPRSDSLIIADVLFAQAEARKELGSILSAESAARSFGVRSRRLGSQHIRTAEAEALLAQTLDRVPDSALVHARHALETFERQPVPNDTLIATSWVDIGILEVYRGEPRLALDALERALEMRTRLFGPDHPRLIVVLRFMSQSQLHLGELEPAWATADRALEIVDRTAPPNDLRRLAPLSNAIYVSWLMGDWPRAIELAQESMRIAAAAGDTLSMVQTGINLGTVLMEAGDLYGAREVDMRILPIAERYTGEQRWIALMARQGFAERSARLLDNERALTLFREIEAELRRDPNAEKDKSLALSVLGQAGVLQNQKRYAEALELSARGIALNDAATPPERTTLVTSRTRRIEMFEALGDTAAIDSMRNDLAAVRDRHAFTGGSLGPIIEYWLARADQRLGRSDAAWTGALQADRAIREQLQFNIARSSDARALDLAGRKPYVLSQVLILAGQDRPERWETAWDRLIRTRGLVRAQLARRRLPPGAESDTALVGRHSDWIVAQRKLARRLVGGTPAPADSVGRADLALLRDAADRAEAAYARALGERSADSTRVDIGLAEVRDALAPGSALIAFAEIEGYDNSERLAAFVARAGDARIDRVELGDSDSVRALVDRWREQLALSPGRSGGRNNRAERECRRLGERVRTLLWDRLVPLTAGAASVALVPDGPVLDLPFHALPMEGDAYLVERGPLLRVLHAERELVTAPPRTGTTTLLAIGDPDYSKAEGRSEPATIAVVTPSVRAGSNRASATVDPCAAAFPSPFAPLPGTRTEVRDIATAWGSGTGRRTVVLLGAEATESAFKELAPHSAIVHVATHGAVVGDRCHEAARSAGLRGVGGLVTLDAPKSRKSDARPATTAAPLLPSPWMGRRVWLALAAADHAQDSGRDENDGVLTAEDVVTLNLAGTQWVVLSACHSALAQSWTREGSLGMRRAFEMAGARSVIASQWAVEDEATAEWMRELYGVRAAGETRASAALQATCRHMLDKRRRMGLTTHPFYWAAFVASGE